MTGKEIVAIREGHRLTRKEFAQLLQVPYATLCRWENERRPPSRFYEDRIRSLSAQTTLRAERQPEQWVFMASNLRDVKNNVLLQDHRAFGTIHALWDDLRSVFIASVHLRPGVSRLEELGQFISNPPQDKEGVVGVFVATDLPFQPRDHTVSFMNKYHERGANHCLVYEQIPNAMTLWKFDPSRNRESDRTLQIPYLTVG